MKMEDIVRGNFLVLGEDEGYEYHYHTPILAYHSLFMTWAFLVHLYSLSNSFSPKSKHGFIGGGIMCVVLSCVSCCQLPGNLGNKQLVCTRANITTPPVEQCFNFGNRYASFW